MIRDGTRFMIQSDTRVHSVGRLGRSFRHRSPSVRHSSTTSRPLKHQRYHIKKVRSGLRTPDFGVVALDNILRVYHVKLR